MSNRIAWNGGKKGLELNHVTDWGYDEDKDILTVYLAAPEMVAGLQDQAVRKYRGELAGFILDELNKDSTILPFHSDTEVEAAS